jgi:hypothetical protein
MGGGDQRSMDTAMELRAIRPTRARRRFDASVDPAKATWIEVTEPNRPAAEGCR